MICDVSTVVNTEGASVNFSGGIEIADLSPDVEVLRAKLNGKITCSGGVLVLDANLDAKIKTTCARCLKELELPVSVDFSETLVQEGTEDGKDLDSVIVFSGTEVDVGELAENNLLLSISSKYLCSDTCRGLCPKCGKDLNEGECNCDFDEIDPRWEKLKNFK